MRIIMVWSWKYSSSSMSGDIASWKPRCIGLAMEEYRV